MKRNNVRSWLLSHFLLALLHIHTLCEWWSLWPSLLLLCVVGFCRGEGGAALFCLLTVLLPMLGLADAEVSPRWLIVYGHLSAWPPVCHVAPCYGDLGLLGGNRKLGGGGEGRGGSRELRRLQPCLSEQQCCRVEHGSQLAGAWWGWGLGCCCLPLTALLWLGDEEEGKTFEVAKRRTEDGWGNLSLFLAVKYGI